MFKYEHTLYGNAIERYILMLNRVEMLTGRHSVGLRFAREARSRAKRSSAVVPGVDVVLLLDAQFLQQL